MKVIKTVVNIIIGMLLLLMATLLVGYFYGSRHFVVKQHTIMLKDLPAEFDGYRIAQFSDFHAMSFRIGHKEDVTEIVRLINSQRCDMICFTGDLVTITADELDGFQQQLSQLKAPDGVYSVMGNHDYALYQRKASESKRRADIDKLQQYQRSFGWNLLLNDNAVIRRGNDSIAIVGVENDGTPPHFPAYGDLTKAQEGLADGTFKVLLSHDPTHWRRSVLPDTDISLTLSGHTHAGQFLLFGWSPVSGIYKEWTGVAGQDGRYLHISNGVGCVPIPFRVGAWPEINVITLKVDSGKSPIQ